MNTTHLTKEMIFSRANEVALVRHLVPTFDPNIRKNHKSIFSKKDNNPSMSIYWDGIVKKWKFKCHQTGYQGDVFSLWAYYYGLDCRTQFKDILETMAREMILFDFLEKKDSNQYPIVPIRVAPQPFQADALLPSSITRNLQIQYIPFSKNNSFSKLFLDYWAQFKITQEILEKFDVRQVAEVSFISNTYKFICYKYTYTKKLAAC